MSLYLAMLPAFLFVFGASWLINIFMDHMTDASDASGGVQPVEVVNINDLGRK
ncbi:hypothetical protein [Paenibacillus phytohabitans]|uniref:hypothetical protein n=1 Tax=Paenibacillus phytohabitans TaxID=2654978 RepID=UPI0014924FBE|nr:hypothetical protein [Paenibacillus phytohabitans]